MKRILLTTVQIGITAGLLWWIFRDPAKREQMFLALRNANFLWLLPGVVCIGVAQVLQTERWRLLMSAQGIGMSWWRVFRVYLIGAFFNLFLLGSTGGDIVKIYYAMRETASRKSAAFLSVLVDRMMGLIAMIAIAVVFCSLRMDLILSHPATQALAGILVLILAAALGLVVMGFLVDRFHLAHKLPAWLPFHARILELATAFSTYARSPRVLVLAFALSLPSHVMNFLAFFFAARAFGGFGGWNGLFDVLSVMPIILTIAAMPVSFAGMGLREGLFQKVFGELFGIPESVAVMISITGFLLSVFWGLIGGLVYLAYRPSGGLHIRDLEEEVSIVEKKIEDEA